MIHARDIFGIVNNKNDIYAEWNYLDMENSRKESEHISDLERTEDAFV